MINLQVKTVFVVSILILLSSFAKADTVLDKIVVIVNSGIITQGDLNKKESEIKGYIEQSGGASISRAKLRKKALDDLINKQLQLQLAKTSGVEISDSMLDDIVLNIAKNNDLTVNELKRKVYEQDGIKFSEFRKKIREQALIKKVQQKFLGSDIVVGEKEINKMLRNPPKVKSTPDQYHVVDILFEEPDDGDVKAYMKKMEDAAKKLATKLKKEKNIDDLVKEVAEEFTVVSNDLGWRKIENFPEIFIAEISKMKVGQVVGPIKAPNGLHLLKLIEINKGVSEKMKITKEQAAEIIFYNKLTKKLDPWLKGLRDKAYIKIN